MLTERDSYRDSQRRFTDRRRKVTTSQKKRERKEWRRVGFTITASRRVVYKIKLVFPRNGSRRSRGGRGDNRMRSRVLFRNRDVAYPYWRNARDSYRFVDDTDRKKVAKSSRKKRERRRSDVARLYNHVTAILINRYFHETDHGSRKERERW